MEIATYQVQWQDGRSDDFEIYEDAVEAVEAAYPDGVVGHDGDLSEGGDVTLCWADDETATNDAGNNSIAAIYRVAR